MSYFVRNNQADNQGFENVYSGVSAQELTERVDNLLLSSGYILKEGNPGNGTYEKGSRTMRILFGAFVKYFKFYVSTDAPEGAEGRIILKKGTSGMSGGLIGMNQVKKEIKSLNEVFQTI